VDIPVAGSAFPGGHNPLVGFFLVAQLLGSVGGWTAPLVCGVDAEEMVDVEDAADAMDEDEFCRWAVLRTAAGVNMLPEFISPESKPLYRGLFGWNELSEATAVMSRPGAGSALW
jgi:hypothetical protein